MDLRPYITDPSAFERELHVPTAGGARRFGDVMADFQRERFDAINPALSAVAAGSEPPTRRFWIEATKGASKDSDLAVCLLWLLAFAPRSLRIQVGAYDADQADEIRLIVRQLLRIDAPLNRAVASLVEVRADTIENTRTGSRAEILTTDSKGSHGSRPDVVLLNELSHVGDREFAETLLDNADKVPTGIVLIATNAGWTDSWQAQWKAAALAAGRWFVHCYQRPAPWIAQADLAESEQRNPPARYRRLWWGEWASGAGDALPGDAIQRALTLDGPCECLEALGPGWLTVAGLDLGLRRDRSALVIVAKNVGHSVEAPKPKPKPRHRVVEALAELGYWDDALGPLTDEPGSIVSFPPTNRIRLLESHSWCGSATSPVSIEAVESAVCAAARKWNLCAVAADTWQSAQLSERLRTSGIPAYSIDATGTNLREQANQLLQVFNESRIELYPDESLLRDLRAARVEERQYGFRVVSPKDETGHGDTLSAFLLALLASRRLDHFAPVAVQGELVCWP